MGEDLGNQGLGEKFLDLILNTQSITEKWLNSTLPKLKTFALWKTRIKEWTEWSYD